MAANIHAAGPSVTVPTRTFPAARLSTIRSANTILVFHHGQIRERGTHDELMEHAGLYRKLYEIQYRETAAVV